MQVSNLTFDGYSNPIYSNLLHFNGIISVIFGFLGMFLTLSKSPPAFGAYKYFLFNICFWAFCFDIYMSLLYTPKILFPALAICPQGILKTTNVAITHVCFWIFATLFGCSSMAVGGAFIYRFAALTDRLKIFLSKKYIAIFAFMHIGYQLPTIILHDFAHVDRSIIDNAILTQWPNIRKFYGSGCSSIHLDTTPFATLFMICLTLSFLITVPLIVFLLVKSFTSLNNQKQFMSPKTYKIHRQLLISIVFQTAVPILTLFAPYSFAFCLLLTGMENVSFVMQGAFILGTCHSPLNTIMMIYFIQPYRRFFTNIYNRIHPRRTIIPSFTDAQHSEIPNAINTPLA